MSRARKVCLSLVILILALVSSVGCGKGRSIWSGLIEEEEREGEEVSLPAPPLPGGEEILKNGDFSRGLEDWVVIDQGGSRYHGLNRVELVGGPEGGKALYMFRRCPEVDGGASGLRQELNLRAEPGRELYLTGRVRADYQNGGALAGCDPRWHPESAVQFRIFFRRADGTEGEWYHGFYYGEVRGADTVHFTRVERGRWHDYSSGDILSEIASGVSDRGVELLAFQVYGFGWDFDGYACNISLVIK